MSDITSKFYYINKQNPIHNDRTETVQKSSTQCKISRKNSDIYILQYSVD